MWYSRTPIRASCASCQLNNGTTQEITEIPIAGRMHRVRAQRNLLNRINLICPVQSHLQKHFRSSPKQITSLVAPSRPNEGRLAIVTNAGRDAVDADGAFDEQHVRRTAKSCGSDAPTLASSVAVNARRRWQTSPVTGKSAKETVKTTARGMPGEPGVTVVTMLVCFFILHARLRAHRAPGIPCALLQFEGETFDVITRAHAARSRRCA